MNVICQISRFLGCSLGLFFVAIGVADVIGFVPHSHATPPWNARLASSAPMLLVGAVLLVPVQHSLKGARAIALGLGYAAAIIWVLRVAISGLAAFAAGGKHWAIVSASLAPAAIVLANAAVLLYRWWQAKRSPND